MWDERRHGVKKLTFAQPFNPHMLRYRRINLDHAEQAWLNLVRLDGDYIRLRDVIAAQMDVGKNISSLYRRLFHVLDLIEDVPGTWVNESLKDLGATPAFDGDNVEDNSVGYSEWVDPESVNDPAVVWLRTHERQAFARAVAELINGEDLDLYVASRYVEWGSAPSYNDWATRFARSERVPVSVWLDQEHRERWGLEEVAHREGCDMKYFFHWCTSAGEPLPAEGSDTPPHLVVLAPGRGSRRRSLLASEASTASSRTSGVDGTFRLKDLVDLGYIRATAKRRITAWENMGLVEKVGYGQYRWVGLAAPSRPNLRLILTPLHADAPDPGTLDVAEA